MYFGKPQACSAAGSLFPAHLPSQLNVLFWLQIDMRGNSLMVCPDPDTVNNAVVVLCDSEATADADASARVLSEPASSPSEALSAGSIAAVCVALLAVALLAAGAYYWRRRRSRKGDGDYLAYTDTSAAALPQADAPPQQASLRMEL